jgi:opacity protein-like surface antigen
MIASRSLTLAALLLATATTGFAQQRPVQPPPPQGQRPVPQQRRPEAPRLHIELDGLYRSSTQTLSDTATPTLYAETGQLTAEYVVPTGPAFSGSASFRFWKNLGIGVGVSSSSSSFPANVTGSIPNPFLFNRARTFEGSVEDLARKELAIGIHLRGLFQLTPKLAMSVFAGPARITVDQDVVTAIQYTEAYPYDTATFRAAQIATDKVNQWGVGAGADLAFYFTRNVGIGVGVKYTAAEADLVSLGGAGLTTKVGGTEFGGGVRLRF